MGDVVNLARARKAKARAEAKARAAENRARHGRTLAARKVERAEADADGRRHAGHRLGGPGAGAADDGRGDGGIRRDRAGEAEGTRRNGGDDG